MNGNGHLYKAAGLNVMSDIASKHLWTQLRWVCDVAELIRAHGEMDWERIMDQTRISGCERMFLLGLLMARDLLEVTLPQIVLRRIYTQPSVKSIANQIRSRLFLDEQTLFRDGILRIRMTERLQSKFRYCLYVAAHMAFDRELPSQAFWKKA